MAFLVDEPEQPIGANLILAHGAGALMDSDFMNTIAEGVSQNGIKVWRFEFPYMSERRATGKKRPPNTQKVLLESWKDTIEQIKRKVDKSEPIFIGGKSMGGRMASLLADEVGPNGLICLGYPFHALGKPEKTRVEHLASIQTPTLILQGMRDPMGNQQRVSEYPLSDMINVSWLEDGDHDLKPRVKSGTTHTENMKLANQLIIDFILASL